MIQQENRNGKRIRIFRIIGESNSDEITAVIRQEYPHIDDYILWDLRKADLSTLTPENWKEIRFNVLASSHHKKTAYVAKNSIDFQTIQEHVSSAGFSEPTFRAAVFTGELEAIQWLKQLPEPEDSP
jgi:hypothetical protein